MRYAEKKKLPFSSAPQDDRNLPDVHLGLYDDVIVFDHVEKVVGTYLVLLKFSFFSLPILLHAFSLGCLMIIILIYHLL